MFRQLTHSLAELSPNLIRKSIDISNEAGFDSNPGHCIPAKHYIFIDISLIKDALIRSTWLLPGEFIIILWFVVGYFRSDP